MNGLSKASRRDRVLEVISYVAVIVAAIAYAYNLFDAHTRVSEDVRLLGYVQLAGANTSSRDHAASESQNVAIDASGPSGSATWTLNASQLAGLTSRHPEQREFVFVVGSGITFLQPDGMATVSVIQHNASAPTIIGTLVAGKRLEPVPVASIVSIPPSVDSGFRFPLPTSLSCEPSCTIRVAIGRGKWDIERVGIGSEFDPRSGPPLWNEKPETFALVILFALFASAASYGCLSFALKWKTTT